MIKNPKELLNQMLRIGKEVIINYINAFNNRDYIAMADLFNFPHIRFANEKVGVMSREEYLKSQNKVSELLHKEGWDHTQIKKIETILKKLKITL